MGVKSGGMLHHIMKGHIPYELAPWRWARNAIEKRTGIRFPISIVERVMNGIATEDVWSLDSHLNKVIHRGVTELRRKEFGHPCTIYNGNGEVIYDNADYIDYETGKSKNGPDPGMKIWNGVLDDILAGIEANETFLDDYKYWDNEKVRNHLQDVFMNGMALLANNYNGLWW